MIEVTFAQLQSWLILFFWPFVRITAFMMAAPLMGHSSVPRQAKIGLAALLTIVIGPSLPPLPDAPMISWASLGIMIEQMLIGVAIGLTMRVMFAAVQAAGEFIGLQMGLAFATFFSPDTGANTMILSRLFYMITLLMFLAFNGHLIVVEILATTFFTLPIGIGSFNPGAFGLLARFGSTIFVSGMLLALPLVGALLIINMSLGILNRSAPQLTVFNVGFPMSLTVGILLLMVLMTDIGRFLERLFSDSLLFLRQLLETMAPLTS
ncbi:flagellar biosynthesis protein FliR [Litchfieldella anticariensis FP35 = DSM 16096]|uniref:Flagellar biosynthetic protein FliR n=1 Tax=Litchfieldella anticariensis (strain DSM 16096 / CECT 5854 / CIP 108499 / LMG 22089 / FP35) TaxID=1121939 RepID=S2KVB3_LITA3|nr:flagellar biosynthetic protein FliR [Halomonas anticariensis]EPC04538.1 flagellar biosynthesis protein FliR [Halomonas anticariensis FP35 = DSM 16096]